MLPSTTPKKTLSDLLKMIPLVNQRYPLYLVGVRGYYLDSMGEKGKNDRGIYDDAIFLISPNMFVSFNANTDPSATFRKGLATLKPGVYYAHNIGIHKTYQALIQRKGEVIVTRDGQEGEFKGYFGINIHRGGNITTSSEGCQTIPPSQWKNFIWLVVQEAKRLYNKGWDKTTIPYVLIENTVFTNGK